MSEFAYISKLQKFGCKLGADAVSFLLTGVSRHNGEPVEGPSQNPRYYSAVVFEEFQENHYLFPHDAERRHCLIAVAFPIWD